MTTRRRCLALAAFLLSSLSTRAAARREPVAPFKVLTFNAEGIAFIHPRWGARRRALIKELQAGDYAVVALQEVWREADAAAIAKESGMPYFARAQSQPWKGDGLMILSRFPILETRHITFTCAPPTLWKIYQGETLADKGALMARVQTPAGELDVYDAHFIADHPPADKYLTWRQTQIFELYQMIEENSAGRPLVIMGDLNTSPQDEEYNILADLLDLQDVCLKRGYDLCGMTDGEEQRRVDHILLPSARRIMEFPAQLAFTDSLPGSNVAYSAHKGVEAALDRRVLALHLRPSDPREIELLSAMRARFSRVAERQVRRLLPRVWVPVYGALYQEVSDAQVARLRAVRDRVESWLITRFKTCAVDPPAGLN